MGVLPSKACSHLDRHYTLQSVTLHLPILELDPALSSSKNRLAMCNPRESTPGLMHTHEL